MARPREFDTDATVAVMTDKFWADGFEATGITDLEKATGVGRASLYAAFGSKQHMLYRSIDFYLDEWIERIVSPIDDGGLDGAADFFRRFAGVVEARPERAAMGCLVVNSVVELGRADSEIADRADRYRGRIRGAFKSALKRAVEDGDMAGGIEERSDLAYMMLMGLYVSVKGGSALEEIRRLCTVAVGVVESWRVTPGVA